MLRYLFTTFSPQLKNAGVLVDVKSPSLCWMGFSLNTMARVIIYGVNGAWYAQEGELTTFHSGLGSRHWPRHWQGLAWQQLLARLHLAAGRVLVQERQCTARRACSAQTRVRWSDLAWGRAVHCASIQGGVWIHFGIWTASLTLPGLLCQKNAAEFPYIDTEFAIRAKNERWKLHGECLFQWNVYIVNKT